MSKERGSRAFCSSKNLVPYFCFRIIDRSALPEPLTVPLLALTPPLHVPVVDDVDPPSLLWGWDSWEIPGYTSAGFRCGLSYRVTLPPDSLSHSLSRYSVHAGARSVLAAKYDPGVWYYTRGAVSVKFHIFLVIV